MLIIGSRALNRHGLISDQMVKNSDWDIIGTQSDFDLFLKESNGEEVEVQNPDVKAFKVEGIHYEFYIAKPGSSDQDLLDYCNASEKLVYASPEVCLAIKMSHRYKKNTPFFNKTRQHIMYLRSKGFTLNEELTTIMLKRQKESLSYNHPRLNVSSKDFFNDTIYTYDHDTIHEAVALLDKPAYKWYIVDGEEVMTSKEKFFDMPREIQLAGVYEETCVLALERSQIPSEFKCSPEKSFMMALEKVCTSITSGWFREFAWENYADVVSIYHKLGKDDYVKRFNANFDKVKAFEGKHD